MQHHHHQNCFHCVRQCFAVVASVRPDNLFFWCVMLSIHLLLHTLPLHIHYYHYFMHIIFSPRCTSVPLHPTFFFINVRLVVFLNTNVIDLYLTLKLVINKLLKTSQILRQIVFKLPVNISELHRLHWKCTNFGND